VDSPRHFDLRLALTIMVGVAGAFLLVSLIEGVVIRLQGLLITLLVSLFLSFGMEPAVKWLDNRGVRRGVGTFLVFLASFLAVAGFLAAMAPLVVGQIRNLMDAGPDLLSGLADRARSLPGTAGESIAEWLTEQEAKLPGRLPQLAPDIGRGVLGLGTSLLGSLLQMLTMLLVTFYLVADGPRLRRALSSRLEPESQKEFLTIWELAVEKTGGYLYSRVLTAIASAIFHTVAFSIIGIEYSAALGIWVGLVSSVIPVIGTYLAGALPLLVALGTTGVTDAVWVLAAVVVYQQVENYLVAPRITAHTLSLHPAIAFVAVLIGAALLGAAGALLALPAAAIAIALVSAAGERHEVVDHTLLMERAKLTDEERKEAIRQRRAEAAERRERDRRRRAGSGPDGVERRKGDRRTDDESAEDADE
jgi:predicted PurR-regulated permease PerM